MLLRKLYLGKLRISYISIKKEQSYFVVLNYAFNQYCKLTFSLSVTADLVKESTGN